eukprot:g1559.t1
MKNVLLRLDSGALIGPPSLLGVNSSEPLVRLSPEEASKLGRLDHRHLSFARKLLKKATEELDIDTKNCPGLETDDDDNEDDDNENEVEYEQINSDEVVANDTPPKKRDRESPLEKGSLSSRSPAASSSQRVDFYDKCMKVLEDTINGLGNEAGVFTAPVDLREAPDYFNIVKEPMDLETIRKRLERGFYENPRDFSEDMRLVWSNCALYNKKGEYIERLGRRGSLCFERNWAMSGLAEEPRLKRLNAGRPAQKYEPEELNMETPTKKSTKGTARANPKAKSKLQSKTGTKSAPAGAAEVDDISSKVENVAHEDRNMSEDDMRNLVTCLRSLGDSMLEDVIMIIRENGNFDMKKDESEEIELDLSELNNRTLWKLDAYLKEHRVQPNTESGVVVNTVSTSESSSSFSSGGSDSEESSKSDD